MISIIIVTKNASRTIDRCLQSVVTRLRRDQYELLVKDGASTDGTIDIIRRHEQSIADWRSEPDGGIYDAMNSCIDRCRGEWVLFLGADDVLTIEPDDLETRLRDPNTTYYGDVYRPDLHRIYDGEFTALKLARKNISHQAIFYSRKHLLAHKYNTRYRIYADYAYNIKAFNATGNPWRYIPVLVAIFAAGGTSSSGNDGQFWTDAPSLLRQNHSPFHSIVHLLIRLARHIRDAFLVRQRVRR